MIKTISSRLRAAFIGPCVGIGGADALMTGLIKNTQNIEWVGAATPVELRMDMASWATKGWDPRCPLHIVGKEMKYQGVFNHDGPGSCIYEACKDANIIISWCMPDLKNVTHQLDIPIIEYAQNSDGFAKRMIDTNKDLVNYKAACSEAAARVYAVEGSNSSPADNAVTVIYNGIDPNRISPRKGREVQRKVWAIPPEVKVVLFMGRMVDEKHPMDVLKAIAALPDDYIAVFAGRGYGQEELYKVAQTFVPGRVAFVDPQYHVGDILAAADCFVLPSDFEGHPLALMEAMLAGVPCVYSDLPVMRELHAKHGSMGLMVPNGADLAGPIQAAIANPNKIARTVVWENYTISKIACQWEEYLHVCLHDWWSRRYMTEIHPVSQRKPKQEPFDRE